MNSNSGRNAYHAIAATTKPLPIQIFFFMSLLLLTAFQLKPIRISQSKWPFRYTTKTENGLHRRASRDPPRKCSGNLCDRMKCNESCGTDGRDDTRQQIPQ